MLSLPPAVRIFVATEGDRAHEHASVLRSPRRPGARRYPAGPRSPGISSSFGIGAGRKSHSAYRSSEFEIAYRWHPLYRQRVRVMRRVRIGGLAFVHIEAAPGYSRELPAWMLQPAVCDAMELGPPQLALSALLELANLVQPSLASGSSFPAESSRKEGNMHGTTREDRLAPRNTPRRRSAPAARASIGDPPRRRRRVGALAELLLAHRSGYAAPATEERDEFQDQS